MSKRFKVIVSLLFMSFIIVFLSSAFYMRGRYEEVYNDGVALLESGEYVEAVNCFSSIPDYIKYRDISELLKEYGIPVCPHCGRFLG